MNGATALACWQVEGSAEDILAALRWAGIPPDEGYGISTSDQSSAAAMSSACGPYVQSQRLALYREAAELLVTHGFAYKCYYTDEQVQHYREVIEARATGGFVFKLGSASEVLGARTTA